MDKKIEKIEEVKPAPKRQIIIETDGNDINIVKAEVAGNLELTAILQSILQYTLNPDNRKQLK